MLCGVSNFERQAVDMNMKVGTFIVMFRVTFIMITSMILQTCMLTANLRIGDFQLIISLPSKKAVLECALVLILLTIWINSLSVLVRDRSSPSYFSRKLFEFGAYANSLDHLDCSLAVFYNEKFISGSKFLSSLMKAVVGTCFCAISLDHLDFRLLFGSHSYTKSG